MADTQESTTSVVPTTLVGVEHIPPSAEEADYITSTVETGGDDDAAVPEVAPEVAPEVVEVEETPLADTDEAVEEEEEDDYLNKSVPFANTLSELNLKLERMYHSIEGLHKPEQAETETETDSKTVTAADDADNSNSLQTEQQPEQQQQQQEKKKKKNPLRQAYGAGGITKAVLVAVNYLGTRNQLTGAISALNTVTQDLEQELAFVASESNCKTLTDLTPVKPTKFQIMQALQWLVQGAKTDDVLLFHFAGHGAQAGSATQNEALAPLDFEETGLITDEELKEVLLRSLPQGANLICVFDVGHSQPVLDLAGVYNEASKALVQSPEEPQRGNVYVLSSSLNVFNASGLPEGYTSTLAQTIGPLSQVVYKAIGKQQSYHNFVTTARANLATVYDAESKSSNGNNNNNNNNAVRPFLEFQTSVTDVDLANTAFNFAFANYAQTDSYPIESGAEGADATAVSLSVVANVRASLNAFKLSLADKPEVDRTFTGLLANLARERRYREVLADLKGTFYSVSLAQKSDVIESDPLVQLYLKLGGLHVTLRTDPLLDGLVIKVRDALLADAGFRDKLVALRKVNPVWHKAVTSKDFEARQAGQDFFTADGAEAAAAKKGLAANSSSKYPSGGITKAVLCGVSYEYSSLNLRGAVPALRHTQKQLKRLGFQAVLNRNCRVLSEEDPRKPTYYDLLESLDWLTEGAQPGDVLFFSYVGHGAQLQHTSKKERKTQQLEDNGLAPMDYETEGYISQSELRKALVDAVPRGVTLYAVLDIVHSGSVIELRNIFNETTYGLSTDPDVEESRGTSIIVSGSLNLSSPNELPSNYEKYLEQSVGLLTFVLFPLLETNLGWAPFVTKLRKELLRCSSARRALRQIPLVQFSREVNLRENPFAACFPAVVSHIPHKHKAKLRKKHVPESAQSVIARLYDELELLRNRFASQPAVIGALTVLRSVLFDDDRYRSVLNGLNKTFSVQSTQNINKLRQNLYFHLAHLCKYSTDDLDVLEAAQAVQKALLKDKRFRRHMSKIRDEHPQWYKLMHEPVVAATEEEAADDQDNIDDLMYPGQEKPSHSPRKKHHHRKHKKHKKKHKRRRRRYDSDSDSSSESSSVEEQQQQYQQQQAALMGLTYGQQQQPGLYGAGFPLQQPVAPAADYAALTAQIQLAQLQNQATQDRRASPSKKQQKALKLAQVLSQVQSLALAQVSEQDTDDLLLNTQKQLQAYLAQSKESERKSSAELVAKAQAQGHALALAQAQAQARAEAQKTMQLNQQRQAVLYAQQQAAAQARQVAAQAQAYQRQAQAYQQQVYAQASRQQQNLTRYQQQLSQQQLTQQQQQAAFYAQKWQPGQQQQQQQQQQTPPAFNQQALRTNHGRTASRRPAVPSFQADPYKGYTVPKVDGYYVDEEYKATSHGHRSHRGHGHHHKKQHHHGHGQHKQETHHRGKGHKQGGLWHAREIDTPVPIDVQRGMPHSLFGNTRKVNSSKQDQPKKTSFFS